MHILNACMNEKHILQLKGNKENEKYMLELK